MSLASPRCSCEFGIADLRKQDELRSQHEFIYDQIGSDDLGSSFQPLEEKQKRADFDLKVIKRVIQPDKRLKILEIGPGDGLLSKRLSEEHDVFAVDITALYLKRLDFVSGAFVADIESMPFVDEFDLVICCDVLEHVLNEGDAMIAIRECLRQNGSAYIRCPSNEPLITYSRRLGSKYPYVHLRSYSRRSLTTALIHAGFVKRRIRYVRSTPAGFARRNFCFASLRRTRARRHTQDVANAYLGLPSNRPARGADWLLTKIEAVGWILGGKLSTRITSSILQRLWYKPLEIYAVATKSD